MAIEAFGSDERPGRRLDPFILEPARNAAPSGPSVRARGRGET